MLQPEDLPAEPEAGWRHIHIIGGGPAGASCAVSLAEARPSDDKVRIYVYEKRCRKSEAGNRLIFSLATNRRRHQVVTIQAKVAKRVWTPQTMAVMLQPRSEGAHRLPRAEGTVRVEQMWPDAIQMPLVDIEDNGMERMQDPDIQKYVRVIPGELSREAYDALVARSNTILLMADGGGSTTRRWAFEDLAQKGDCQNVHKSEEAAGLFFSLEDGHLDERQAANTVLLTLSQTVFLGNFSVLKGRGFINLRLMPGMSSLLRTADGAPATFANPAYLRVGPGSPGEEKMLQGLTDDANPLVQALKAAAGFFQVPWKSVQLVCGIKISPCKAEVMRKDLAALAVGDAAFQVHFWPGRGLNSGLQTSCRAVQLVHEALQEGRKAGLLQLDYHRHKQKYASYVDTLSRVEVMERSKLPQLPTTEEVKALTLERARTILKTRALAAKCRVVPAYAGAAQAFQPCMSKVYELITGLPEDQVKLLAASEEWPPQNWASPTDYLPPEGVLFPAVPTHPTLLQRSLRGLWLIPATAGSYLKHILSLH
ncbi:hypothetical protein WJX74_010010 [Apatococcus lobatus]|uniref:Uncharacterized protein n=1 Tax=Apatococcus lobatus TaxID=904363 RepID=A0AAW1S0E8_9CHLO